MIEHIGGLQFQALAIVFHGGDRRLERFLAEFLGDAGGARIKQAAGIGLIRGRAGAGGDELGEEIERERLRS